MPISLKQFTNLDEIKRELGKFGKLHKSVAAKVINLRESGNTSALKKTSPSLKKKLDDKSISTIDKLESQFIHIRNIEHTLNTELKNQVDSSTLAKLNTSINRIKNSIESKLQIELSKNRELTDDFMSADFNRLVVRLRKYLAKTLEGKISKEIGIQFLSGKDSSGNVNVVGYITLENLKNGRGQIDPQVVIAITDRGNGNMLINPSLHKVEYPGKFNPGIVIKNEKDAIRVIENQLLVDSSLNIISPSPVPFKKAQLQLTHAKIAKTTISPNAVIIDLDVTDKSEAIEVSNDLYREIYNMVLRLDPRSKSKIIYTITKKGQKFRVVYSFVSAQRGKDAITRNLKAQEIAKLREIFNEDEIAKIRKSLNAN